MQTGEHIEFDRMVSFILANKVDDDFRRQAMIINSHLFLCQACKKQYEALQKSEEALQQLLNHPRKERFFKLVETIYMMKAEHGGEEISVMDCCKVIGSLRLMVKLSVNEMYELECMKEGAGRGLQYPKYKVALKSADDDTDTEKVLRSVLIDERKNKISIAINRELSVYLKKEICPVGRIIVLLSDNSSKEPYFAYAKEYDEDTVMAVFETVAPGNYDVLFGC